MKGSGAPGEVGLPLRAWGRGGDPEVGTGMTCLDEGRPGGVRDPSRPGWGRGEGFQVGDSDGRDPSQGRAPCGTFGVRRKE